MSQKKQLSDRLKAMRFMSKSSETTGESVESKKRTVEVEANGSKWENLTVEAKGFHLKEDRKVSKVSLGRKSFGGFNPAVQKYENQLRSVDRDPPVKKAEEAPKGKEKRRKLNP